MSKLSNINLIPKYLLLLSVGALIVPSQSFSQQIKSQAPIRKVARANYLKALGEPVINSELALEGVVPQDAVPAVSGQKQLTLDDFLKRVVHGNQQVLIQKTGWEIKQIEADGSRSLFEPELVTALTIEENHQRNSAEESLSRQLTSTYSNNNWRYDLALETLVSTGGKLKLGYNLNKLSNSLTQSLTGKDEEYQMALGLSLRQPLLKNAGPETTKSAITAANLQSGTAFQQYRLELMQRVGKAAVAYWDYYQAQQQLMLRHDSLQVAKKIARDADERWRTGKMAKIDVLESKVGVNLRLALLSEAEHLKKQVANKLGNLLSINDPSNNMNFLIKDQPVTEVQVSDANELITQALAQRPEYLAALKKLEENNVKIAFAKNQRRPELDLLASYGLNGLDFSVDDSWSQVQNADYASWSLGIEFRLPLGGGISGRSEFKKAQLEKSQQLMTLKSIEIELSNRIDTARDSVFKGTEQLKYAEQNTMIQKQLLASEIALLHAGKSSSRQVLEKEDNYRAARETLLKNQVNLQTALVELELSGGTILGNHGLDVLENELL